MINWNNATVLFYLIIGSLNIGWSVEYFHNKKYIRGGIFMMGVIISAASVLKELFV